MVVKVSLSTRGVWRGVPGALEVDLAEVGAVTQDGRDGSVGPGPASAGAQALVGEVRGDGAGAEAAAGVEVEDLFDDEGFVGDGDEVVVAVVGDVAVGGWSSGPAAFAGFGA